MFYPSHPRLRGTVHRFLRITPECRHPYKGHGSRMRNDGLSGIRTHGILLAKGTLPLSYEPNSVGKADRVEMKC